MSYEAPEPFAWNYCGTCGAPLVMTHDGQSVQPHCAPCRRFFYRNPVPAACCFVRRGKDELLFTQRAVEPCKGEWTLPGGFIELGETAEEAVLRELLEETNLRASTVELLGVSTKQSPNVGAVMVLGFVVIDWSGEEAMRPDTDAMALRFFPRHARPTVPFSVHRELLALYDARDGHHDKKWLK
ncbi:MAG: NUDIX domain-containing protein [Candidatus Hydrogenedentes bacterium]|nr:NUDIX domain-containing protein [Candidatus Hydrogenedentota bacterium]